MGRGRGQQRSAEVRSQQADTGPSEADEPTPVVDVSTESAPVVDVSADEGPDRAAAAEGVAGTVEADAPAGEAAADVIARTGPEPDEGDTTDPSSSDFDPSHVSGAVVDLAEGAYDIAGDLAQGALYTVEDTAGGLVSAVGDLAQGDVFTASADLLSVPIETTMDAVGAGMEAVEEGIGTVMEATGDVMVSGVSAVLGDDIGQYADLGFRYLGDTLSDTAEGLTDYAEAGGDALSGAVEDVGETIDEAISDAGDAVEDAAEDVADFFGF